MTYVNQHSGDNSPNMSDFGNNLNDLNDFHCNNNN